MSNPVNIRLDPIQEEKNRRQKIAEDIVNAVFQRRHILVWGLTRGEGFRWIPKRMVINERFTIRFWTTSDLGRFERNAAALFVYDSGTRVSRISFSARVYPSGNDLEFTRTRFFPKIKVEEMEFPDDWYKDLMYDIETYYGAKRSSPVKEIRYVNGIPIDMDGKVIRTREELNLEEFRIKTLEELEREDGSATVPSVSIRRLPNQRAPKPSEGW